MRRISTTLALAGALALVLAAQPAPAVRGVVFDDLNGNGVRDEGERGVAGVAVSNQRDIVRTGADGNYELPAGRGHGLVYVSVPPGYRTYAAPWRRVDAADRPADFALATLGPQEEFSFLHISDTHVRPETMSRLALVRRIVDERRPDLMIVTGDLVSDALRVGEIEARGYFEQYVQAIADFPLPVWSALGNHDIFGVERHRSSVSPEHPLYGKRMFRHYLGPNYYSFNHGKIHFVALDTVDVDDLWYYGHVDAEQLAWLEQDLATVPEDVAVVTFGHIPLLTGALALWGYREGEGAANDLIDVAGRRSYRHVVANPADVIERLARVRWPLALGGHTHTRETLLFETAGQRTRFEQAAPVVEPFPDARVPAVSGVTLYRVRGAAIREGEFIRLSRSPAPARPASGRE